MQTAHDAIQEKDKLATSGMVRSSTTTSISRIQDNGRDYNNSPSMRTSHLSLFQELEMDTASSQYLKNKRISTKHTGLWGDVYYRATYIKALQRNIHFSNQCEMLSLMLAQSISALPTKSCRGQFFKCKRMKSILD